MLLFGHVMRCLVWSLLLGSSWADTAKTELPIPLAAPITLSSGRPGTNADDYAMAYQLAIEHLNEDIADLPYRFTAKSVCDTRQTVLRGYECAVEMHEHSPVGIVGGLYSSVTLHMVVIATQQRLLQCSPTATSPDLSEQVYPYFFRVVSPDDARAEAVMEMLRHFQWWRAAVIHTTDRYSAGLAEKLARGALQMEGSSMELSFYTTEPNFNLTLSQPVLAKLERDITFGIRSSQVRIIISILLEGDMDMVLHWGWESGLMGPDYAWIGFDSFALLAVEGYLQRMDSGVLPSRDKYGNFLSITSRMETTNRTARMQAGALARFNTTIEPAFSPLIYDCVLSIGKAVETLLQHNRSLSPSDLVGPNRGEEVAEQLRDTAFNLEFQGASGLVRFAKPYTANAGDRVPVFSIKQWNVTGLWEEVGVYNMAGNSSIRFARPVTFSGATELADSSPGCQAGTEFNATLSFEAKRDVCQPCPLGKYRRQQKRAPCLACPPGFKCDDGVNGTREPEGCEPGQFSGEGARQCSACTQGSYSSTPASSQCLQCPSGLYQVLSGATLCDACPMGFFQPESGSTYCTECPETLSTATTASTSRSNCGCPVKFRWAADLGRCVECEEDLLDCERFNATPQVMMGYYLADGSPRNLEHMELFRCNVPEWCPGEQKLGDPICAEAREGLNCGRCSDGFYESAQSCLSCTGLYTFLYVLGIFALFLASGLILYLWDRSADEVGVGEGLFLSITVATALAVVQRLGVVGRLGVAWPEGVKEVLALCAGLLSNFLILTPSCALSPSLLTMYLARLCTPLLFVVCCVLWWGLSHLLHRHASKRFPAFSVHHIVNTVGLFVSVLYIYAVIGTLSLVDCYENPNGERTVRDFSFALCSGSDFSSALPLFAAGVLLYIVGMVGATLYALWVAPEKYRRGSGFRVMIRFLVHKFRPDKYWYGLVMMLASFLMALVTVVFPDSEFMQLLCLKVIASSQLFAHCLHMPYTQNFANVIENAEHLGLIVLLSLGSYFYQDPLGESVISSLSHAILGLFIIMGALVLCGFAWGLYLAVYPQRTAARQQAEVDSQVDCILAGCQEILGDPQKFRQLLSEATSYVERERAAKLMSFFNDALDPEGGTPRSRLFLSLRKSESIRASRHSREEPTRVEAQKPYEAEEPQRDNHSPNDQDTDLPETAESNENENENEPKELQHLEPLEEHNDHNDHNAPRALAEFSEITDNTETVPRGYKSIGKVTL